MGRDMSDHVAPAPGYPAAKKPPLREGAEAAAGNAGGVGESLPHNPYRMAADAATDDAETQRRRDFSHRADSFANRPGERGQSR